MNLTDALVKKTYTVQSVRTDDKEMDAFLFSLGCYAGESITVVKQARCGCIITLKSARYSIDAKLARAISIV